MKLQEKYQRGLAEWNRLMTRLILVQAEPVGSSTFKREHEVWSELQQLCDRMAVVTKAAERHWDKHEQDSDPTT